MRLIVYRKKSLGGLVAIFSIVLDFEQIPFA